MSHTGGESDRPKIKPYTGPAGGWGSVKSVESILAQEGRLISGNAVLLKQNKPDGFTCVSCAWAKPAEPHPFEYCENGAKATAWELTGKRVPRRSSSPQHTLAELRDLARPRSRRGRPPHPSDALGCGDATLRAGRLGRGVPRDRAGAERRSIRSQVVLYASGRASLETSYM